MKHYFTPKKHFKIDEKELISFNFKYCDFLFNFYGIKGVFSKDKLDLGTKKLIENLVIPKKRGLVLDLGCGTGVIGTVIYNFSFNNVVYSDINFKAVYISKKNWENNKYETKVKQKTFFIVCNGLKCFKEKIFDAIYFYPPEKSGKENIKKILDKIENFLKEDGFLEIVITKKMKWLIDFLKEKKFDIEILEKSSYIVFKAKKLKS